MPKRDEDRYLFSSPKPGEERDGYLLAGPESFDEYLHRMDEGTASEAEQGEFDLRLIQHFVDCVYEDKAPPKWLMVALADAFHKVLHGSRWEDEFHLPWTKASLPYTRAEWRALGMSCDIENARRQSPESNVTEIIKDVASKYAVSYERARENYYSHRSRFVSDSEGRKPE